MRIFFTLLSLACFSASAQLPAPGYLLDVRNESQSTDARESVIWSEDFSAGITEWQNEEQGGIAQWEYRGPSTEPNNEVGSRGSCIAEGTTGAVLLSPSWNNGFVIFDSNWWDNPDNPCTLENFGSGPAPGPHLATLTSPSINLSSNPDVALRFNQYLKNYDAVMRVEISAQDGPWNIVFDNSATPFNSALDMQVQVPVSLFAGGMDNVRIRFVFDGLYYFWQLDDICIVDILQNDLSISNSSYGDFDFTDPAHDTGFEMMEYTKYPDEMVPLLKFSTHATNIGSLAQTSCVLDVVVKNIQQDEVIHSASGIESFEIASGETMELRAGTFQMPAVLADYHVYLSTSQDATDGNESNNNDTLGFQVTDVTYARDFNFTNAIYVPTPDLAILDYEIGNVFLVTAPGQSCYSISVALGAGTVTPSTMYARLYEFDAQETIVATPVGTTSSVEVDAAYINGYGEGNFAHLVFDNPVPVNEGSAYLAVIGSTDGAENVVVAFSGGTKEFTSWVHFLPDQWYYLTAAPMVRMNFGTAINVEDQHEPAVNLVVTPNPASNEVKLDLQMWYNKNIVVSIVNAAGELISVSELENVTQAQLVLPVSHLSQGLYHVTVSDDSRIYQTRFMKL